MSNATLLTTLFLSALSPLITYSPSVDSLSSAGWTSASSGGSLIFATRAYPYRFSSVNDASATSSLITSSIDILGSATYSGTNSTGSGYEVQCSTGASKTGPSTSTSGIDSLGKCSWGISGYRGFNLDVASGGNVTLRGVNFTVEAQGSDALVNRTVNVITTSNRLNTSYFRDPRNSWGARTTFSSKSGNFSSISIVPHMTSRDTFTPLYIYPPTNTSVILLYGFVHENSTRYSVNLYKEDGTGYALRSMLSSDWDAFKKYDARSSVASVEEVMYYAVIDPTAVWTAQIVSVEDGDLDITKAVFMSSRSVSSVSRPLTGSSSPTSTGRTVSGSSSSNSSGLAAKIAVPVAVGTFVILMIILVVILRRRKLRRIREHGTIQDSVLDLEAPKEGTSRGGIFRAASTRIPVPTIQEQIRNAPATRGPAGSRLSGAAATGEDIGRLEDGTTWHLQPTPAHMTDPEAAANARDAPPPLYNPAWERGPNRVDIN